MGKHSSVEGQMDIFEAMNRAAEAVDRMVEKDREEKKKKTGAPKNLKSMETETEPEQTQIYADMIRGEDMHASMQRTFVNPGDDDFAMVAYIDYNMIYWKDWNSPASLRRFEHAKEAVDFYFEQLEKLQNCSYAEPVTENEPFRDMKYVVENVYVECED